jgi:drug/metabolite transporter (DMT)-like permease
MWGLVFIAPVILDRYPPALLSVARYLAFGLIALPLAAAGRAGIVALGRADWLEALRLSLVGNLLYYGLLAAAIQVAGAPLPTMIIGTLPLVIAVTSNLSDRALPWRRLLSSLAVIAAGIALVNRDELAHLAASGGDRSRLLTGALLAVGAVACWTWYPIRNARWLQRHPALRSSTWATAQGLATLPLALAGCAVLAVVQLLAAADAAPAPAAVFDWPLGPTPALFIGLMLLIGLSASWLGTLCWNRASQLLPTSLAGQLIVFETLSALLYAFLWRGTMPPAGTLAGIALLVAGVTLGIRAFAGSAAAPTG